MNFALPETMNFAFKSTLYDIVIVEHQFSFG